VPKRFFLVPVVALALAAPTHAGLFKKSAKPDPATYVPALIETLKASKDEKARAAAAAELDEYDAKAFPDILPSLMEALSSDPSSGVRSKAAESIGKVRPITPAAGYALERAAADDKSLSVKVAAKMALMKYRVLGHMPGTRVEAALVQSAEPPLAAAGPTVKATPAGTVLRPTPPPAPVTDSLTIPPVRVPPTEVVPDNQSISKPVDPQTGEPPLAEPGKPALTSTPKAPAPVIVIPTTPAKNSVVPVPTTPALPAPQPLPGNVGPALPPKN
jgi:hypothetical protein